uniref:Uncharacterized protein n=1 Tax=viral metagenome TaxID=1070528 RepID=A0A6C0JTB6_9ZZZZ
MFPISEKLDLNEAYKAIDAEFAGWFSSHPDYASESKVFSQFEDITSFNALDLFAGMLWMFFNYPMFYLIEQNPDILGSKLFYRVNLVRVNCVLQGLGISTRKTKDILKKIGGAYTTDETYDLSNNFDIEEQLATKYKAHPFKYALGLLAKRRTLPENIGEIDKEMQLQLGLGLTYLADKEEEALGRKQEKLLQRQTKLLEENKKYAGLDQYIQQAPSFFDVVSSVFGGSSSGAPDEAIFIPYDNKFWGY